MVTPILRYLLRILINRDKKGKRLLQVHVQDFEDIKSGYRIIFTWSEANPFFANRQLSKDVRFSSQGLVTTTGEEPEWRGGVRRLCKGFGAFALGSRVCFQLSPRSCPIFPPLSEMWFMAEASDPERKLIRGIPDGLLLPRSALRL